MSSMEAISVSDKVVSGVLQFACGGRGGEEADAILQHVIDLSGRETVSATGRQIRRDVWRIVAS